MVAEVDAPLRLGMVGLSPGNGHPFSFSAIVNGYDEDGMATSGWDGIHRYLSRQDRADIGLPDARVTHVWTQERDLSRTIAKACRIETVVNELSDMTGTVDAVVIARDDHLRHAEMAMPFLEAGLSVFVDKPLSLDRADIEAFRPYLASGKLMSCSGLRFARELDDFRGQPDLVGNLMSIQCAVINGWDKYGIHMIDAALGAFPHLDPKWIVRNGATRTVGCAGSETLSIANLGPEGPFFGLQISGSKGGRQITISDNFTAFRRTLQRFVRQARTGELQVPLDQTMKSLSVLVSAADIPDGTLVPIERL
ncbi:Gfo/Idh/MocA family oxidoreductase [uncultured Algimonas sp.]|uniref:Gfo/Idh/MocA family oxidoreductase n=1 Tax=uncultured Algimonas sp. TaxID=1547920 RepID=UPI002603BC6F|nr:Gfo/Idh/MocA family oxidoreductase [uncultured Algimonas sp.]